MQQDIQQVIGSIVEDQDSVGQQEIAYEIKQKLVIQPPVSTTHANQKKRYPTLSKMKYFLTQGIRRVRLADLSNEYFVYQRVILESSVMTRTFLELIFYLTLFIICFIYTKQFLDQFTQFQKVSGDYLDLKFESIPPAQYLPNWQQTCLSFKQTLKDSPPKFDINMLPTNNNYQEFCQITLWVQGCGVQEIETLYLQDCYKYVKLILVIYDIGLVLKVFFGLMITLGVQQIHLIFNSLIIKKRAYHFSLFDLIDYLIAILSSVIIYHLEINLDPDAYETSKLNQYDLKTNCKIMENLLMFFFLLLWCRFFGYMRKTEKLGKVIKIFELMIRDLSWFLLILFLALSAFSMFFFIGYGYEYSEYESLMQTFLSLFSSIFGNFSLNEKTQDAQVYLIIFLIIFNLIVLNLLIAILSNTYNLVSNHGNMEYSLILYNDYKTLKKNDNYGSSYYFPPPLCFINTIFAPFIYFSPKFGKQINQFSFHISYFILVVIYTIIFFGLSLILIVPSYVITFFQIVFNSKNAFTLRALPRFFLSFVWLVSGIIILLGLLIFNDTKIFIESCYLPPNKKAVQKIFEIDQYEKVNISFMRNILKKLRQQTKKKNTLSVSCFKASVYTHVPSISNHQSIVIQSPTITKYNCIANNNNHFQITNNAKYNNNNKDDLNCNQNRITDNIKTVDTEKNNDNRFYQFSFSSKVHNNEIIYEQNNIKKIINDEGIIGQNPFIKEKQQGTNRKNQQNVKTNDNLPLQESSGCSSNQFQPIQQQIQQTITDTDQQLNNPSYSIKVLPAPNVDRENKIIDSVTTIIDDSLVKEFPQNPINKADQIETITPLPFNPQTQIGHHNTFTKQSATPSDFPFPILGKNKISTQKASLSQQDTQFQNLKCKQEKNLPNIFNFAHHEEQQDVFNKQGGRFTRSDNSNAQSHPIDIISAQKITQMYYQEQQQYQYDSNLKREVATTAQIQGHPPSQGHIQAHTKQDQSTGLWLELFLKRTSFATNLFKYSMLLSFLSDAKKSVDYSSKIYNEKNYLEKQSELTSLIDVELGKRALQKYLSGQQSKQN